MDEQMKMIKEICMNEKSVSPIEIVKKLMKCQDVPDVYKRQKLVIRRQTFDDLVAFDVQEDYQ